MHIEHFSFSHVYRRAPKAMSKTARSCRVSSRRGKQQRLANSAMAFRTCLVARGDPLSALAKLPAAPIAASSTSKRVIRVRCTKHTRRKRLAGNKSSANAELLDQILVARFVSVTEIIEQLTALADKLEQPTTGMVVIDVGFEMLGE